MNRSEIQKARLEEAEFQKAYEELFGETFEKAKHKDGDMHPNGKWVWVSSANGGKGDWRTANGRAHKKMLAGKTSSSAGKTDKPATAEKSSTDKPVKTDKPTAKTKVANKSKNETKTSSSNPFKDMKAGNVYWELQDFVDYRKYEEAGKLIEGGVRDFLKNVDVDVVKWGLRDGDRTVSDKTWGVVIKEFAANILNYTRAFEDVDKTDPDDVYDAKEAVRKLGYIDSMEEEDYKNLLNNAMDNRDLKDVKREDVNFALTRVMEKWPTLFKRVTGKKWSNR